MATPVRNTVRCLGVDFTSRPRLAKPVWVADTQRRGRRLRLRALRPFTDFAALRDWLAQPGDWVGGFDLPFGLPRELVEALGWPTQWLALMRHYQGLSRDRIRATFKAFCDARPVGAKFAHRACDLPAGSSPSMKWVNPPVAYMLHAGVPLLLDAGVHLPALHDGDPRRVALEAYPGLLAREIVGRQSYKSDATAKHDLARRDARGRIVDALSAGHTRLGLRLVLDDGQRDELVADGSGDRLDALLCAMQAAWATNQPRHGLPQAVDPLEGWIVSA